MGRIGSEAQLDEMAQRFYDATAREFPGRVVVYGRSIGTGLAVKVAAENGVRGLVLESPYYGLRDPATTSS